MSVEVDLRRGIPAVDLVGLADGAVKESRERMKSAIRNSGFEFPPDRVLISLSPADLKKEGAGFDLPIALAVLEKKLQQENEECDEENSMNENSCDRNLGDGNFCGEKKDLPWPGDDAIMVLGELELNGKVRPVRGVHAATSTAYDCGIRLCIVPKGNLEEALEVKGMKVFGADTLEEAFTALQKKEFFISSNAMNENKFLPPDAVEINGVYFPALDSDEDFADVKNQGRLVRALQIAAAGKHNLLAYGPPGCGKTLALQKFPSLLPLLTVEEAQSVTRIYSIAGLLTKRNLLLRKAPFRQPHQTCTIEGMCGGGPHCIPGEISLSHNGVLFLDEAAEFRTSVLQMLRVPLESKKITLSRAGRSTVYPADFQLLMATNPCPCGNFASKEKICLCSGKAIDQYWQKFSAPLLDRIDFRIHVELGAKDEEGGTPLSSAELRKEIALATKIQWQRQGKKNSHLSPSEIKDFCPLSQEAKEILNKKSEKYSFSPRSIAGCIKVARTISDMKEEKTISKESIDEAIEFRHVEEDFIML